MELEYEGDPSFLTGGIEALLVTMGGLVSKVPADTIILSPTDATPSSNGGVQPPAGGQYTFTTNTIAAHMEAKSTSELIICALAQLDLVQGKTAATRAEIITEMKGAVTYYSANMVSNMSKTLAALMKNKRINQTAKETYALSATERKSVESKVAAIS